MTSNKYIPYARQTITDEDMDVVKEVLQEDFITQGPKIDEFEQNVAAKVNAKFAIAVNSATSALHIACKSLGLKNGDWIWTSPTTFVASSNCGLYCGANIDFVDIEPNTGLMSIKKLQEKLIIAEKIGKLPKILIPVHLAGNSCNMEAINELSRIYQFSIVEDASHAIGAKYNSFPIGSCEYSQITVFSFHPVKIITTGEGGMAITNDHKLARKMKLFRSHGIEKDAKNFITNEISPWKYEQQVLGYNYRITDIQAALGNSQLKRLDNIIIERNKLLENYRFLLKDFPLELLHIPSNVQTSVHLAIILLKGFSKEKHKRIFISLRKLGIGVQIHYTPVYLQPFYRNLGFEEGYCPNSEEYAQRALSLPLYPGLEYSDQVYVKDKLSMSIKEHY